MLDDLARNRAVDYAIHVLNQAVALEPEGMSELLFHRVSIGRELADHPTIQCRNAGREPDTYEVSALGLINGLFGADENDWGFIYAHIDESGSITHFSTSR